MDQRGRCGFNGAELLAAEKCAGLSVFRVTALESSGTHSLCLIFRVSTWANPAAVGAFCMQRSDYRVAFLLSVSLDMEGACGWAPVPGTVVRRSDREKGWQQPCLPCLPLKFVMGTRRESLRAAVKFCCDSAGDE